MIRAGGAALLLLALTASADDQRRGPPPREGAISVRQQVIVRIAPPRMRMAPASGPIPIIWREGRGPRCIPIRQIVAATSPRQESVDLIFRDSSRVRVQLERRCPAIDFYRALYLQPTGDGRICADRDVIRSRTGGECGIDQFRTLTPERR
jgi:hypothetical protein